MKDYSWFRFQQAVLIIIPLLIASGCAEGSPSRPGVSQPEAEFTADKTGIRVVGAGNSERDVQPDESVRVGVDDLIQSDKTGRGTLNLPDLLDVEVFRNTDVLLRAVNKESGGATFVQLEQVQGQTRVSLQAQATIRVTLETIHATVETIEPGTEFLICQAPGKLTCIDVLRGAVEVTGQGKRETVRGGEATYVLAGKPPTPAICAPVEIFNAWVEQMRGTADTPTIGQLVADLPQQSCSGGTSQAARLPSAEGMVKIDYGTYQVGRAQADEFHSALRDIPLDNFWIDQYEVTNSQYQEYLNQTGSQAPTLPFGEADHPVRGVTWDQADAYCKWTNKRLPAEAEWEVAGRGGPGPKATLFPWGDDPDAAGQIDSLPLNTTYPVGSYSFNKSFFGVYDMVGTVWQWVMKPYDSVPEGYKILRGGQFGLIEDLAYRQPAKPDDENFLSVAGFRCAADRVKE